MIDSQNNNLERALEWIFSRPELEEESEPALDVMDMENHANANILAETGSEGPRIKDGPGSKFFSLELAIVLLCHTYPSTSYRQLTSNPASGAVPDVMGLISVVCVCSVNFLWTH